VLNRALFAAAVLLASLAGAQTIVPFTAETPTIASTFVGDVAIFPNTANPAQGRLIGTDRVQNGLYTYFFDGGYGEFLPIGPMTGVDVRTGLRYRSAPSALMVATGVNNGLYVYGLNDAGMLFNVLETPTMIPFGAIALWSPPDGGLEAFVDTSNMPYVRQLYFHETDAGLINWSYGLGTVLPRPVTAMVADSRNRRLYLSVASVGIYGWTIDSPDAPTLLEPIDGGSLNGAPTGLGLYALRDGGSVLMVSVLGRDDFAAYRATTSSLTPLTRFQISRGTSAVLVRNSQYLDISQATLPHFSAGVLAVADPNTTTGSNYKLIGWETLAAATDPKLPNEYDASVVIVDAGAVVDSGVVIIGGCPDDPDGGTDGGTDGGGVDAGRRPCVRDAGSGTGGGGGSGGGQGGGFGGGTGGSGGGSGGGGGGTSDPKGCCAGGPMGAIFPGAFVLLWTLSFRRRKT